MSEKLYALLLRLYPSRFRGRYAAEAMQVFRDRIRDERGVLKRARLWLDLLVDVSISVPREHHRPPSPPAPSVSGLPSFLVLEEEPLRPDRFLFGTVLALLALGTFGYLLTHGGNRVLLPGLSHESLRSVMAPAASPAVAGQNPAASAASEASEVPVVTAAERQLVIRKVVGAIQVYDPDRAESQRVAALIRAQERRGEYNGILNGPVFAALLTQQIKSVTRRTTVTVLCGQEPVSGSAIWIAPSAHRAKAWQRIDDHFSVTLARNPNP